MPHQVPSPPRGRDHRIDLLRGFALASIFINHVPGNVLEPLTVKNFGLSDSAELFVLLAGIAAAFAYLPRFLEGEWFLASARAVKRAGTLYVAHLASTVVGIAVASAGALLLGAHKLLEGINIPPVLDDPAAGLLGVALMTHQLGYHNILPMYVCLLLGTPLLMALARHGTAVVLAASVALYLAVQAFALSPPNWPTEGGWFFNPLAWQLLFVVGFVVGMRIRRGLVAVPFNRWLYAAAVAWLVGALVYHRWNLYGTIPDVPFLPRNMQINEKPWLALPRLAHILSLAYVVGHSPLMRWLGKAGASNPLAVAGRHALPVFWFGTALSMVGQVVMDAYAPGAAVQVALLVTGLSAQYALALALDRVGAADRLRRSAPPRRAEPDPASGAAAV